MGRRVALLVQLGVLHQTGVNQRNLAEKPHAKLVAATSLAAQRSDDMQKILLQVLPPQVEFAQRHAPPGPDGEKQIGQIVDEGGTEISRSCRP